MIKTLCRYTFYHIEVSRQSYIFFHLEYCLDDLYNNVRHCLSIIIDTFTSIHLLTITCDCFKI